MPSLKLLRIYFYKGNIPRPCFGVSIENFRYVCKFSVHHFAFFFSAAAFAFYSACHTFAAFLSSGS